MSDPDGPLAIIGIGNVLLGDDGAAVRVAGELARMARDGEALLPANTAIVDGGTLGLDLLSIVADARAVLFIDAADEGLAPGAIDVIDRKHLHGAGCDAAVPEIVNAALLAGVLPEAVCLVAIQVGAMRAGLSLSRAIANALPAAVDAVVREAWKLSDEASARWARGGHTRPGVAAPAGVAA